MEHPLAVDDAYWQVTLVQMSGVDSLVLHLEPTRPAACWGRRSWARRLRVLSGIIFGRCLSTCSFSSA